jgi:putative acetyltransferase
MTHAGGSGRKGVAYSDVLGDASPLGNWASRYIPERSYRRRIACGVRMSRVIVREQQADDYKAIRHVYAESFRRPRFRRPQSPGSLPPEVGLFEALWEAGDVIPALSFTALTDGGVVGHVPASDATVATDHVVAVGPIGVLPDHQGAGIGSALMDALLTAADAAGVPLVVLLGAPQYYSRFGFRPAQELGVISPEPEWRDAFQARPLTAYTRSLAGQFRYASAFSVSSL